jgi:hypothetical protein
MENRRRGREKALGRENGKEEEWNENGRKEKRLLEERT